MSVPRRFALRLFALSLFARRMLELSLLKRRLLKLSLFPLSLLKLSLCAQGVPFADLRETLGQPDENGRKTVDEGGGDHVCEHI